VGRTQKLQVFENRVFREKLEPNRYEVNCELGYYIRMNFMIYTGHLVLFGSKI
jgi:hypothetical protein